MRHGVVIPAYNEPRLASVLERFDRAARPSVVVVDDGSDDGTGEAARRAGVVVRRHERRRGVGAAIRTGLAHLRAEGFDVAVVMAGNGKDDPNEIPRLLAPLREGRADYVQASRFLPGAGTENMPPVRYWITRAVPLLWSIRFGRRLTEATSGFRAYRLSILDDPRIDLDQDWLDRYELEFYLHYKVLALGYRYTEVPVRKVYPADGRPTSKIRLWRDWWSLLRPLVLLSMGLRR